MTSLRSGIASPFAALLAALLAVTATVQLGAQTPAHSAPHATPRTAPRTAVATLLAADSALAAAAARGLRAGLIGGMAEDAVLLYPGASIAHGRARAAHLLDSSPGAAATHATWRPMRAEVSADGTRGYSYGRGVTARHAATSASGMHYVAWWRRDGGRWVLAAWLFQRTRATPPDTLATWPCHDVSPVAAPLTHANSHEESRAAVIAADSAFAARADTAGPAAAFAEYAADDAVSLGARPVPTCGKAEIGAQFQGGAPGDLRWAPIVGDAAASADLGYTVGSATVRARAGTFHSKYITVWKRQGDGSWRFVADGGNAMPAAPSAAR